MLFLLCICLDSKYNFCFLLLIRVLLTGLIWFEEVEDYSFLKLARSNEFVIEYLYFYGIFTEVNQIQFFCCNNDCLFSKLAIDVLQYDWFNQINGLALTMLINSEDPYKTIKGELVDLVEWTDDSEFMVQRLLYPFVLLAIW
jgi:hypothetical protein